MERIRIGDACEILNGYAFKSDKYVADGIRVIRIANVQKGYIEDSTPAFYPLDSAGLEKYMLEEGDLLMSLTGNVGRVAMLEKQFLPAALNQRVACLRLKTDRISKGYLFHILNSDYFEQQCIQSSKGVAQKNMSTEWLKDYEIPLYSKEEQAIIERILDKVRAITSARQQEFRTLDGLIKARFVELFVGKKYEIVKAGSIIKEMRNGVSPSTSGGHFEKVLTLSAITQGKFDDKAWKEGFFTDCPSAEKRITEDDFYICRGNGNKSLVGMGVYALENRPDLVFPDTVIAAHIDTERMVLPYLWIMWQQPEVRKQLESGARTTNGTYKINQKVISEIKIICPPINEQEVFADFIKQVNKSKVVELIVKNMSLLLHSGLDILIIREVMR